MMIIRVTSTFCFRIRVSSYSIIARINFFFFQAEDGIRDHCVTGVQTCALPIFNAVTVAMNDFDVFQVVADKLGIPMEDVEIIHGDSDSIAFGMGTYGSRSIAVGGSAIVKSIEKIFEKGKKIAAHKIEASREDIEFGGGKFNIKGTERSLSFGEVGL